MIDPKHPKYSELLKWTDPEKAQWRATRIFGKKNGELSISTRKGKKFSIRDPASGKLVHFGGVGHEDFLKHQNKERRDNYLVRSAKIKGSWYTNPYSPNSLARSILW